MYLLALLGLVTDILKRDSFLCFEKTARKPVLVLGAGVAGEILVRQLQGSSSWYVAGFLDDDLAKRRKYSWC